MELINKTGVPIKKPGDSLSAKEINDINIAVNKTVDVANAYLKDYCNANTELGTDRQLSLLEAVNSIPIARRTKGMIVRFLDSTDFWIEYSFIGSDLDDWSNEDNWAVGQTVDGGEW